MLVHSADFLREHGHRPTVAGYFGQEMNWGNYAIGKINSVLHGLEADIRGGASTITDPAFLDGGGQVKKFSLVLANFPFSDEFWWLRPEQQTDDKKKKEKLKKEVFGKEGYKDPYGRFGRGTAFKAPPAGYGDYAFILHILASLAKQGRAGIVCPQGVLFRGQPEVDEDTGESKPDGTPKVRRRKADDEHLIREALLKAGLIDAVISLPLNIFYGAGLPACLVILRKDRPKERRDKVLLIYAARHYRELSAKNELRPQDVMRMLVHYHAYADAERVCDLVEPHKGRLIAQIDEEERQEVDRLQAFYEAHQQKLDELEANIAAAKLKISSATSKGECSAVERLIGRFEGQRKGPAAKLRERDEKMAEAQRRAESDREQVIATGDELVATYADPDELIRHARVIDAGEIEENEFNLNIPRYIDTFEPEPRLEVKDALNALAQAQEAVARSQNELGKLVREIGYGPAHAG